jgi:hypothetical protein
VRLLRGGIAVGAEPGAETAPVRAAAQRRHSNVIDAHIKALRDKIDRPFGAHAVETVRGAGYRLRRDGGHTKPAAAQSR